MPGSTATERQARRALLRFAAVVRLAKWTRDRYYQNGIEPFDEAALHAAFENADRLETRLNALSAELKRLKAEGDKAGAAARAETLREAKRERGETEREIRSRSAAYARYRRVAGPYLDACRLRDRQGFYEMLKANV